MVVEPRRSAAKDDRLETHPTLSQRVYDRLQFLIMSGALAPGERLAEKEWAERLGISRGPVREAVRRLAADGLVDIRPRRAAIIHRPDEKELDDFFYARQVIEVSCAQLAAKRTDAKGAQKLRQLLVAGRKSLLRGDADFLSAEHRLHAEIHRLADNSFFSDFFDGLGKRRQWYFTSIPMTYRKRTWELNAEIVEAIAHGNDRLAAERMQAHAELLREVYKIVSWRDGETEASDEGTAHAT